MWSRHHLASSDQDGVSRRDEREEDTDKARPWGREGWTRLLCCTLCPHQSRGRAISAFLLPRPCHEPRTRPASCHLNRQGGRLWEQRGQGPQLFLQIPRGRKHQEKEAGVRGGGAPDHPPPSQPEAQWTLGPGPPGPRVQRQGRQTPEASLYARSPRQSVQRLMDLPKLLHRNLLTSPGLSFLIGMIGAIPKSQACLKDK